MFTKFAAFEVLSAVMVPEGSSASQGDTLVRTPHRAVFDYDVRPGYLYVRSRAISSRCNDNFDEFPAEEIKTAYKTFVGKPVFVNHHNDNHRRARGGQHSIGNVLPACATCNKRKSDSTLTEWRRRSPC